MRLLKLAFRIAAEHRRSLLSTAAALMLVALVATAGGSIISSLGEATHEYFRRSRGEYTGLLAAPAYAELQASVEPGVALSAAVTGIGALSVSDQLTLVRISWTDLSQELSYRGIARPERINLRDGVLLGGSTRLGELRGSVVRVATPDGGSEFVRVREVIAQGDEGAELLVHLPAAPARGPVRVRLYGVGRADEQALRESVPVVRSGWRADALRTLLPLRSRFAFLMAALIVIAAAVLLPAQLVLARRTVDVHRLLLVWGFGPRERSALVYLTGSVIGAVASTAGGLLGMLLISVLNAGDAAAIDLLPFGWRQSFELVLNAPVTPSVEWAMASIGLSTLLGVVTAFPTAPFVATLLSRRSVWN